MRSSDNSRLMACWAGQHFHSTFQAKARGVSILVANHILFEPNSVTADKNGRFVIVSGKLFNTKVILANVYAPNVDDVSFFDRVFSLLHDLDSHFLILGGDFNCWLDPTLDRSSGRPGAVSKSALCIQSFLSEFGVSDIWRFLHPQDRQYSFFSSVHHSYSRIDYIFIDNRLIPQVRSCTYHCIVISDHAPVAMALFLPNAPQPMRQWRFNSSLLSDTEFVKFIEQKISFFFETNITSDVSALVIWDTLKAYLRGEIIAFTANKKRLSQKDQLDLISKIREIDQQYAHTQTLELYNKRLELKTFDIV